MPIVAKYAEKLFPGEHFTGDKGNVLLSTIHIPKNLLYLTDCLPKPRYMARSGTEANSADDAARLNLTDGGDYESNGQLPALPRHKISRPRLNGVPQQRSHLLVHERASAEEPRARYYQSDL
jgi:hypothetical protein